jgi:hypothetical protein
MLRTDCLTPVGFSMAFSASRWRRYSCDSFGRRVLTGLTFAETCEFVLLDEEPPVDERGNLLQWEIDDNSFPPNQARWLELYKKHRAACERLYKNQH